MSENAIFEQNLEGQEIRICQKDRRRLLIHFRCWEQHEHVSEYA